jgi:arylsulfatase A-like enzyme
LSIARAGRSGAQKSAGQGVTRPSWAYLLVASALLAVGCSDAPRRGAGAPPGPAQTSVIVFVWDGLRADSVSGDDTPNLMRLRDEGVLFDDQHATYPTLTMMNSASFATGNYPATNGFYGNYAWVNGPADAGVTATGVSVDLAQPVFTEDYGVLDTLNRHYGGRLLLSGTLFEAAQDAGISTAVVGKVGAAYLQDRRRGGWALEERLVWPAALMKALEAAGLPRPYYAGLAYGEPADAGSPDPTKPGAVVRLSDGVTPDPTRGLLSTANADNAYLMRALTEVLLPGLHPRLLLVWLRNPDTTEHPYGPGTAAYRDALHSQDALFGQLRTALERLGLSGSTDILVASDHGHSSVSGPLELFPLRGLADGGVTGQDVHGYAVSGEVRTADLINRAKLGLRAFDGLGCIYSPVLSGITASGASVYPGLRCGGKPGTTEVPPVPAVLEAHDVVVVANDGSEYLHVPSHDAQVVRTLVRFLQSREEFGPIFVARRYGAIPGTLPLDAIRLETASSERTPDLVVSFAFDEDAVVQGMPGTELGRPAGYRGTHGSFSPRDVHNTLIAAGPHFRRGFHDTLPSGNVDVPATVARLLDLHLEGVDGRVLEEALLDGLSLDAFVEETHLLTSSSAEGLHMLLPTDPDGHALDTRRSRYHIELQTKMLRWRGRSATYVDWARAVRD